MDWKAFRCLTQRVNSNKINPQNKFINEFEKNWFKKIAFSD